MNGLKTPTTTERPPGAVLTHGARVASYPALHELNVPTVSTAMAAHFLGRQPETLGKWAADGKGPLQPLKIHGRLAWRVADLRRLLGEEE